MTTNFPNGAKKETVLICDDHQILGETLRQFITQELKLSVVGLATNSAELNHLYETHRPGLLIIDLRIGAEDGLEIIRYITDRFPKNYIIVLSQNDHPVTIRQCMKSGALGFVSKNSPLDELAKAIETVRTGQRFLCSRCSLALINEALPDRESPKPDLWKLLTERELQIMNLLSEGATTRIISEKLFVSIKTIEKHKTNIMKKLKVKNTLQALRVARESGYIQTIAGC